VAKHDDNARQERRERPADDYTDDLERANRRDAEGSAVEELARGQGVAAPMPEPNAGAAKDHTQHARKGQAESPRELTLNQPEKKREGHH
jgi:hypothetical protein